MNIGTTSSSNQVCDQNLGSLPRSEHIPRHTTPEENPPSAVTTRGV